MSDSSFWIDLFRVGRHVDASGVEVDFGEADADALVAGFDPDATPAPLVIGHPEHDAPAYGWTRSLRRAGDVVQAEIGDVAPEAIGLVRRGAFRRQSASLYQPSNPSNPRPGQWSLRHVGLLGAAAPAIKGLRPVQFAATPEPVATFEFAAARDAADDATPAPEESTMADQAAQFAERQAALEARMAKIEARERRLAEAEAAAAAAQAARVRADALSFAEGLVARGSLMPVGVPVIVEALVALEGARPLSFAEGQAEKAPAQALRELLASAAPIVSFAEHAGAAGKANAGRKPDAGDLARRARALVDNGEFQNPADAVRHLEATGA